VAGADARLDGPSSIGALAIASTGSLVATGPVRLVTASVVNGATVYSSGVMTVNGNFTVAAPAIQGTAEILAVGGGGNPLAITVSGPGALLDARSGSILIGSAGSGLLTVANGGSVFSTTEFASDAAFGTGGTVTVTGAGSQLTAVGQFVVGFDGNGKLQVQSGGVVFSGNSTVNPTEGMVIGQSGGSSSGAVAVSGIGSEIVNVGQFYVGGNAVLGGGGSVFITNGGLVTTTRANATLAAPGAAIAAAVGSDGSQVNVSGAGSTFSVGGPLVVGGSAAGFLIVTTNGTVAAGGMDLGQYATGSGNVTVVGSSGTASLATIAGQLTVGDAGIGDLEVLSGGTVTAGTTIDVGAQAGSSGDIDVDGVGSVLATDTLDLSSTVNVGMLGVGVIVLGAGTHLDTNNLNIGTFGVIDSFGGTIDPLTTTNNGTLGPTGVLDGSVHNNGLIYASSGQYTVTGSIDQGPGTLEMQSNSTLEVGGDVSSGQTVDFNTGATGTGVLRIDSVTTGFDPGLIEGFEPGDQFEVTPGITGTFEATGADTGTYTFYNAEDVALTTAIPVIGDAADFANAITYIPCFAQGTRIATPRGMVAVEDLRESETVLTATGGQSAITWLGHRRIAPRQHPRPQAVMPVRVQAHAFGAGQPSRDVFLSPDHAVFVDGVLIPIRYLFNGATIAQQHVDSVTYWHVELERHDVVMAEGLACESYLDTGNRGAFANGGAATQLHASFGRDAASAWYSDACAPLVEDGPVLAGVRGRLAARAAELDHAAPRVVDIEVTSTGWTRATIPADVAAVRLVSPSARPGDDRRRLGALIRRLRLGRTKLALDDARLGLGFHEVEVHGATQVRWTDGAAILVLGCGSKAGRGRGDRLLKIDVAAVAAEADRRAA
jgi:collagen type I alpha